MKKRGAYDCIESLDDLKLYRRRRKLQCIIIDDAVLEDNELDCAVCGKPLVPGHPNEPPGYRACYADYWPKSGKFYPMHYTCSWSSLMNTIFNYRIEGGKLAHELED